MNNKLLLDILDHEKTLCKDILDKKLIKNS